MSRSLNPQSIFIPFVHWTVCLLLILAAVANAEAPSTQPNSTTKILSVKSKGETFTISQSTDHPWNIDDKICFTKGKNQIQCGVVVLRTSTYVTVKLNAPSAHPQTKPPEQSTIVKLPDVVNVEIEDRRETKTRQLSAIPSEGKLATESSAPPSSNHPFSLLGGMGVFHGTYRETDISDVSITALTAEIKLNINLYSHWNAFIDGYLTAVSLANNHPETLTRFLKLNGFGGYIQPVGPWSFGLLGGYSFEKMFVTANAFGYSSLNTLILHALVSHRLTEQTTLSLGFRLSPVVNNNFPSLTNRETAIIVDCQQQILAGLLISGNLSYSALQFQWQDVHVERNQWLLSLSLGW